MIDYDQEISRTDIRLKHKGDYDKQFQYQQNLIEELDRELDEVKKSKGTDSGEEIKDLKAENEVLSGTVEDMNKRLNEMESRINSFVPDADSADIKPDVFEAEAVEEVEAEQVKNTTEKS